MPVALIVVVVLAVAVLGALAAFAFSARRGGALAGAIIRGLLGNALGRRLGARLARGAAGGGELTPESLRQMIASNPRFIEAAARAQGADAGAVRSALGRFDQLTGAQQQELINRAAGGTDSARLAAGLSGARSAATPRDVAKRKAAAKARAKTRAQNRKHR